MSPLHSFMTELLHNSSEMTPPQTIIVECDNARLTTMQHVARSSSMTMSPTNSVTVKKQNKGATRWGSAESGNIFNGNAAAEQLLLSPIRRATDTEEYDQREEQETRIVDASPICPRRRQDYDSTPSAVPSAPSMINSSSPVFRSTKILSSKRIQSLPLCRH